jgi:isoamyl acetate esterase
MKWKKFILIGDSNTQFGFGKQVSWVSSLADMLQRRCDVINRGFSGYNSNNLKAMIPSIMSEFDPVSICGVTILLGSNDSASPINTIQHVPVSKYMLNIKWIIDYLIEWGINKSQIILISPPMKDEENWSRSICISRAENSHLDKLVQGYAQQCAQIAKECGVHLLDFYKFMEEYKQKHGDEYKNLLHDGLHLSSKGSQLLIDKLAPLVNDYIIKINSQEELRCNFPYWRELNNDESKQPQ